MSKFKIELVLFFKLFNIIVFGKFKMELVNLRWNEIVFKCNKVKLIWSENNYVYSVVFVYVSLVLKCL